MSMINLSFMGVQPINIDSEIYARLLTKEVSFLKLDNIGHKNYSFNWLQNYNSIYDIYDDLYELDILQTEADLKKDFYRAGPALNMNNKTLQLSQFLTTNAAKLYFDPRFVYFVLIYQIDFQIPLNTLVEFLDYDATQNNIKYNDFYNMVRNAIVKEESSSKLSEWGAEIQKNTRIRVKELLEYVYKISIDMARINIPPHSCNISNFVLLSEPNNVNEKLIEQLISLNIYAERLTSDIVVEPLYNQTVYFSFNGRFHTVIVKNEQDKYRFQPLQFHIQYMWFLVERYNKIMNNANKHITQTSSLKIIQAYLSLIHVMINKIELLGLHDMNFKHSIEVDIDIYEKNEKRWSIPKLLESSRQYVSFFKDYLDRSFNQKNVQFQKKTNLILLVISFIQVLALVSVWNDYLSTINKSNLDVDSRILNFFGGVSDNLMIFNLYVPLGLIIVILSFSIYLWKYRAK